ncbi:MAG: hypothetical protein JNN21_14525 [Candidatus Accumulibacter sp.]|nr:hypothetical protein [Accumulibacter sp.]
MRMEASGDGKGLKEGISCVAHGSGPKRAAYFNTESPADSSDFADGVVVTASSQGTGNVLGFSVNAFGSGAGQKEGIVCTVQGSGHKYGGQFRAYSDSGTADGSEGLRADARSEGTGNALGFLVDASGSGPGQKLAVLARSYGAGEKLAGVFRADSDAGSTDTTLGLEVVAQSEGTGRVSGIRAIAAGEGSGFKEALSCSAGSGSGPKRAAYFSADNSVAGSTDTTEGVYVLATSAGSGQVIGLDLQAQCAGDGGTFGIRCATSGSGSQFAGHFHATSKISSTDETRALSGYVSSGGNGTQLAMVASCGGAGTGHKYGVYAHAYGSGEKHAGHFFAESPAGSTERTNGVHVGANSNGSGSVYGLTAFAVGSGTGPKYALHCEASGNGEKWAGFFVGNVHVNGIVSKSGGNFLIDHPLDPENKTLRHSFVESPEDLCLYRGKVQLDAAGQGTVRMPSYFAALTREEDATVSLTAIGSKPFLAGYDWNRNFTAFTVHGEPGREVSYLVLADRDDPVIHQLRRPVEEKKGAGYFEKGQLLNPEAYGKAPKAAPDAVATARQTTARMDCEPPTFADLPAPPTPTAPPVSPWSPVATPPFPALEEEHKRMDEAWARSREEERQRMQSFQQEEERRRRQLEEALAARSQQPGQSPQEGSGPIETVDATTETPIATPESAPPRRKKAIADRKKR